MNDEEKKQEELLSRIADLESQVQSLEKDLIHDHLTGLKTRMFFEEESKVYLDLINNLSAGKRRQWFGFKNISFLFIDIDHFKKVNDTYGHDVGDLVLKKVAQTVMQSVRVGDTVARWGGEEIVASLLGANLEDSRIKAEEIRSNVEALRFPEAPDLQVTVSIGIVSSEIASNFEELIKRADEALYVSKETGRNKVTICQK
ncbi:MAG: GGDEF domain-containing protein [Parcubacteria group bacterium]|nr:GGDEF domain-containing protein [Parcubacteria group bacterium]